MGFSRHVGNVAICLWHSSDWICTDVKNNFNHLLHRSDVLMLSGKKKSTKLQKKPNFTLPSSQEGEKMQQWNKGLNLVLQIGFGVGDEQCDSQGAVRCRVRAPT